MRMMDRDYVGVLDEPSGRNWDMVFISHASEDKDDFVRPLSERFLKEYGFRDFMTSLNWNWR